MTGSESDNETNSPRSKAVTARLDELSAPKQAQYYKGDRPTPIWPVSDSAKNASATARLAQLAECKNVHQSYQPERSPYSVVSEPAKKSSATPRLEQLSTPKANHFADTSLPMGEFSEPITPVSATSGRCSARVEALAEAKNTVPAYRGERPVQWPVPDNVKNASASPRLQQLARPKSGRLQNDDYDPYKVTIAAQKARPTPRVEELSTPLPRKVRAKKGG